MRSRPRALLVSINLWLISDKKVSAETEAAIENALNEMTQSKYTTKVDLVYFTEDEYYAALDAKPEAAETTTRTTHASADIRCFPGIAEFQPRRPKTTIPQRRLSTSSVSASSEIPRHQRMGSRTSSSCPGKDRLETYAAARRAFRVGYRPATPHLSRFFYQGIHLSLFSRADRKYKQRRTYAIPRSTIPSDSIPIFWSDKAQLRISTHIDASALNSFAACGESDRGNGQEHDRAASRRSSPVPTRSICITGSAARSRTLVCILCSPRRQTLGGRTTTPSSAFETAGFTEQMLLNEVVRGERLVCRQPPENAENFGDRDHEPATVTAAATSNAGGASEVKRAVDSNA